MKKRLSEMTDNDAFILFGIHSDFGSYSHPFYNANHDNGWQTTNSFSKHILEADKKKLFELFDIDEEFYSSIKNPEIVVSRDATLSDGTFIKDATSLKLKQFLKSKYGYRNFELKRGRSNKILEEKGIQFTYFKEPKYKIISFKSSTE